MEASSAIRAAVLPQKRKASGIKAPSAKKPRQDYDEASGWEEDSATSSSDDEPSGDESPTSNIAPTPSTPASASQTPTSKPRPKNHHCPYLSCTKAYTRPVRLEEHIRSHTNTRPHVCPEPTCGKSYLRDSHLKHHVKSAHTSIRDYICNWSGCAKAFQTATRLERHIATHEGKEQFRCRVEGCGMTFRKHTTLQKHTKSVHEGAQPFVCTVLISCEVPMGPLESVCNSGFETAAKLKAHQTRMHSANRYTCDLCSEISPAELTNIDESIASGVVWFATYSLLQSHIKTAHPPTCPQCSAVLPTAAALSSHIEIHHETSLTERQSHFCPEPHCERGFTSKGNLTMHIKAVHHQKKDFVCGESDISGAKGLPDDWKKVDGCGWKFATKGNLVGHFRTVHLGDRRKSKKVARKESSAKASHFAGPLDTPSNLVRSLTDRGMEGNTVSCLEPFCFAVFYDANALFIHLEDVHGIADEGAGTTGVDRGNYHTIVAEETNGGEHAWHGMHEGGMDIEDDIAGRALDALREELQKEAMPIDPMLE